MLGKHVWEITSQYTPQDLADWQAFHKIEAQLSKRKRGKPAPQAGKKKR